MESVLSSVLRKSRKSNQLFTTTSLAKSRYREMPGSEAEKTRVKDAAATEEKYPWHLLRKTILLLNCFMGNCRPLLPDNLLSCYL